MSGYVYILQDNLNKYYIGSCKDLVIRYQQHLRGAVHTTSRMSNPKLVFSQKYLTIEDARKIERKLKKLKRKDYITKIVQDGFIKMKV